MKLSRQQVRSGALLFYGKHGSIVYTNTFWEGNRTARKKVWRRMEIVDLMISVLIKAPEYKGTEPPLGPPPAPARPRSWPTDHNMWAAQHEAAGSRSSIVASGLGILGNLDLELDSSPVWCWGCVKGNKFWVWTADPSPDQPRLKR